MSNVAYIEAPIRLPVCSLFQMNNKYDVQMAESMEENLRVPSVTGVQRLEMDWLVIVLAVCLSLSVSPSLPCSIC